MVDLAAQRRDLVVTTLLRKFYSESDLQVFISQHGLSREQVIYVEILRNCSISQDGLFTVDEKWLTGLMQQHKLAVNEVSPLKKDLLTSMKVHLSLRSGALWDYLEFAHAVNKRRTGLKSKLAENFEILMQVNVAV